MRTLVGLIAVRGDRRCTECGLVHDAYWRKPGIPSAGYSWADPDDGHPYNPEGWEDVARRYGYSATMERGAFPPLPVREGQAST